MPKRLTKPSYLLHKARGLARTKIDGKWNYLGPWQSPESLDRYDRLVAEWLSKKSVDRSTLTIDELALKYLAYAERYYVKNGVPTDEVAVIRAGLRFLLKKFGPTLAVEFGPRSLKIVRDKMIAAKLARTTINKYVDRIRRAFRWAVSEELLQHSVYAALTTMPGLKAGRTEAQEPEPVRPVADAFIEMIKPHLNRYIVAMIELQRLTGMRPGEVVQIRPIDINMTGPVWEYKPASHKMEHRGESRVIMLGPKAQDVLRPFLTTDTTACIFSPTRADQERSEQRRRARKSRITPSQSARRPKPDRKRPPKDRYSTDSYRRAIQRACEKVNVAADDAIPVWFPNRLRHSAASTIRREYGIEAARLALGHNDAETSLIYAERDLEQARTIAAQIG